MLGRWPALLREPHQIALPAIQRRTLDLEAATERLREEREEVRSRLENMTNNLQSLFAASAGSNADDEHDPEGQTIAYERAQLSALIQAAREHLAGIEGAILRLNHGGYGICEVCHQPIPVARLDAKPTARTCVQHSVPGRR
jgi:RNA polymerase-binding transcription factor DksA